MKDVDLAAQDDAKKENHDVGEMYITSPCIVAAVPIQSFEGGSRHLDGICSGLELVATQVKQGDIGHLEELLVCQIELLNKVFTNSVLRMNNNGMPISQIKVISGIALKSQNQCRRRLGIWQRRWRKSVSFRQGPGFAT